MASECNCNHSWVCEDHPNEPGSTKTVVEREIDAKILSVARTLTPFLSTFTTVVKDRENAEVLGFLSPLPWSCRGFLLGGFFHAFP